MAYGKGKDVPSIGGHVPLKSPVDVTPGGGRRGRKRRHKGGRRGRRR